jgi:hypothetical protein
MSGLRIAALVGDISHDPGLQQAALRAAFGGRGATLDVFTDPGLLPWERLSEYAALVLMREGLVHRGESQAMWQTGRPERAITEYLHAGGGVVAVHAGLAFYEGPLRQTLRGAFISHPKEHPEFLLRPLTLPSADDPARALMAGVGSFSLRDELYHVDVDTAGTTRLLEAVASGYESETAAWAHTYGKGRVFCFTPGHTESVLMDPAYQSFLVKGILWACGS